MSRRGVTHRPKCADEACTERASYEFSTQRDYREHLKFEARRPYRCWRHTKPDDILSPSNTQRVSEITALYSDSHVSETLFWTNEAGVRGSSLTSGPGFRADACDFPPGTVLRITAEVILPGEVSPQASTPRG